MNVYHPLPEDLRAVLSKLAPTDEATGAHLTAWLSRGENGLLSFEQYADSVSAAAQHKFPKQEKKVRRGVQAAKKDEPHQRQKRGTIITSASEREDAEASSPSYYTMNYRELQSLCKQRGIRANEKKAVLVALKHCHASKKSKEF